MVVKIRLARFGKKKHPFYRIVAANSLAPRDGRFIERIGQYDPMLPKDNKNRVVVKVDRLKHWLNVGAQPTKRVLWFIEKGMIILEIKKKKIEAKKTEEKEVATQKVEE
ncbi:30S ribosomal protein S16 [Wolbachia endosymbiont of Mansonella ozzardi]|uniref:30S ribosomal protein S16 n=1 Tax=Wolbachia endosymbiont of Mansonella ozzardi TaxID=137464 RepID=UPI001CE12290|nr:30S ribosomal protein S16 [Wolbachia endosymbiont of Mansonella ozzardi]MCA4774966.1 30S ribosomal protein S16 [Wolbachia endosymbiont of Mansonella ozzardi]